jgi:hypothetical protein
LEPVHEVPSLTVGFEHVPLVGSHVPTPWHWSLAVHVTGFEPVHTPAAQAYAWSQRLDPVHEVPSLTVGFEQTPLVGTRQRV